MLLVAAVIFAANDTNAHTHNEGGGLHKSWKKNSFFLCGTTTSDKRDFIIYQE